MYTGKCVIYLKSLGKYFRILFDKMEFAPCPTPKPKVRQSFGLITSSDDVCNSDADAEALFMKFPGRSSESGDDDTAAGGAAGGSTLSSAFANEFERFS